jgi:hypothetical protein
VSQLHPALGPATLLTLSGWQVRLSLSPHGIDFDAARPRLNFGCQGFDEARLEAAIV